MGALKLGKMAEVIEHTIKALQENGSDGDQDLNVLIRSVTELNEILDETQSAFERIAE